MQEAHFGYVDYEMNPKPSYHAVKNLLAILHDEKVEGFQPQSLQYSVEGPKDELRHLLLQKTNGDFYLAVWPAVAVWDENMRKEVPVKKVPVEVRLPSVATTLRVFWPTQSPDAVRAEENVDRFSLELGAEAVILQISAE